MNVALASFPVMSANTVFPKRADTRTIVIEANHIYDVNGYKVGVFGITTTDTKSSTNPEGLIGVEFMDETDTARKQLENNGADVIAALTHLGTNPKTSHTSTELCQEAVLI